MLLVDAYNALHVTGVLPPHLAGLDGPALADLIARSRWGSAAVLVCDGVKPRGWPTLVESVELRFAGPGRDADTLLERLIADAPDPRRLTVVSSDNRVKRAARRGRCKVLTSHDFLRQLVIQIDSPRVRPGSPSAGKPEVPLDVFALRHWLAEFGIEPEELRRMAGEAKRLPSPSRRRDEGEAFQPRPAPKPSVGAQTSDLSDDDMRSMLAEALKMWSRADIPTDLDLTAWLDSLLNPPSDGPSPRPR